MQIKLLYNLRGTLILIKENFVVVECGGVGYKCFASSITQNFYKSHINTEINIYTYVNIRQDAIDIFGFCDLFELECFKLLISVSGVGSKAGLSILSQFSPQKLIEIICSNDSKSLTLVSGIGAKTAQRIVLELKDKVKNVEILTSSESKINNNIYIESSQNKNQAIKALNSLGYSQSEIKYLISELDNNMSVEEIIKFILKNINKNK